MKPWIISFSLIFGTIASANANVDVSKYRNDLNGCDMESEQSMDIDFSQSNMTASTNTKTNCYIRVAGRLIDTYYKSSAKQMKRDLIDLANKTAAASINIYNGPDECYPKCGSMTDGLAAEKTATYIKTYVIDLINYTETYFMN